MLFVVILIAGCSGGQPNLDSSDEDVFEPEFTTTNDWIRFEEEFQLDAFQAVVAFHSFPKSPCVTIDEDIRINGEGYGLATGLILVRSDMDAFMVGYANAGAIERVRFIDEWNVCSSGGFVGWAWIGVAGEMPVTIQVDMMVRDADVEPVSGRPSLWFGNATVHQFNPSDQALAGGRIVAPAPHVDMQYVNQIFHSPGWTTGVQEYSIWFPEQPEIVERYIDHGVGSGGRWLGVTGLMHGVAGELSADVVSLSATPVQSTAIVAIDLDGFDDGPEITSFWAMPCKPVVVNCIEYTGD